MCDNVCPENTTKDVVNETVTPDEFDDSLEEIVGFLGDDTPCETYSDITLPRTASGFGGLAWDYQGESKGKTKTKGCDTLAVMAYNYTQTKKRVMSILNCTCSVEDFSVNSNNRIVADFSGSDIQCKDFSISQRIQGNFKVSTQMKTEQKQEIASIVKNFVDTSVDNILDKKSSVGSTSDETKSLTKVKQDIKDEFTLEQITETVSKSIFEMNSNNELELTFRGVRLSGQACEINQDIILDLEFKKIMGSTIQNLLENDEVQKILTELKQEDKEENEGLGEAVEKAIKDDKDMVIWILVGLIALLFLLLLLL